jgi:hypothetical protein
MSNDYIAIALIAAGSSWARAASREKAIRALKRIVRSDWSNFVSKSDTINVTVVDVTGIDNVYWDVDGIWNGDNKERVPAERIEREKITL